MSAARKIGFPKSDSGYFHLTPSGWVRRDHEPFPENRLETWRYNMACENGADKEQVRLTRVWVSGTPERQLNIVRERFGEAISPAHDKHITIDCEQ